VKELRKPGGRWKYCNFTFEICTLSKLSILSDMSLSAADLDNIFIEKVSEKYQLNERELKKAFSRFDTDGNGQLDLEEMKVAVKLFLNGVSDKQVQAVIDRYDINGDGKISFEEFTQLMLSRNSRLSRNTKKAPVARNSKIVVLPYDPLRPKPDAKILRKRSKTATSSNNENEDSVQRGPSSRDRARNQDVEFINEGKRVGQREGDRAPASGDAKSRKQAWGEIPRPKADNEDLDFTNSAVLEAQAQIFLTGLRGILQRKAIELRMEGQVKDKMVVSRSELTEALAADILDKVFQRYTGVGEGRSRDQHSFVGFPDFSK
jgi:hypothetical protein